MTSFLSERKPNFLAELKQSGMQPGQLVRQPADFWKQLNQLPPERLSSGLGWGSIALGVPMLVSPRLVAHIAGVRHGPLHRLLIRLVGVREMGAAAALLTSPDRPEWIWTRVAGDAMDLTMLGIALAGPRKRGRYRTILATAVIGGITAVDVAAAMSTTRAKQASGETSLELTAATTVRQDPSQVYARWRKLDELSTFMAHVDEVTVDGPTRSHWKVSAPFNRTVEWDAEIVEDLPDKRLSWRSVEGSQIDNEGIVSFSPAPGGRGTEVHVTLRYDLPGGAVGATLARLAGEDPHQQLDDDLRRFKQVMETGEVVRSEGAPGGKRAFGSFPQHPARPLSDDEIREVNV